ncbi:MAG: TolA-binding protein, partial [Salinirussus sp.]
MQRSTALTVALLVACAAAVPLVGIAASGNQLAQVTENSSNSSVTPGERLSGVVGVQGAELEGEVDERAFGIRVAQAATNESRAAVVADKLVELEQRVEDLDERTRRLGEARANGSISEGEYRAELSEVAAQSQS